MVSHSFFLVNGKPMNIPSAQLKKGDTITLKPHKVGKAIFKNLKNSLKKQEIPNWLKIDSEKLEGKITGEPSLETAATPVEIPSIFEFYSR